MGVVEVKDASGQFGQMLDRVEKGEEILITRAGKPVARLLPDSRPHDPDAVATALERIPLR